MSSQPAATLVASLQREAVRDKTVTAAWTYRLRASRCTSTPSAITRSR